MKRILLLGVLFGGMSWGQFSYSGCEDVQPSDFKLTALMSKGSIGTLDNTLNEPVQIDFEKKETSNGSVYSMIYFIERHGKIKVLHGVLKTIKEVGQITGVKTGGDGGLTGIALDNDFSNNKTLYLYYATTGDPSVANSRNMRVSRFTLNNDGTLNNNSEKILIEIEGNPKDDWHHGGPMAMDAKGDLWITVGNDSPDHNSGGSGSHISTTSKLHSDEWGASNTANMRGSILRIHPDASVAKGYTIPEGNFGTYWAQKFASEGKGSLAQEYANPAKVLPEIYTKGHRSNFSVSVDPKGEFMTWGEVNPASADDEIGIVKNPVFAGYPYFYGTGNKKTTGHSKDPLTPDNTSPFNTGVGTLPPHVPGAHNVQGVAITGPIYRYSNVKSDIKFPPHFDGKLFITEFNQSWIEVLSLNGNGSVSAFERIFTGMNFYRPIDLEMGPDGALYVLNYAGWFNSNNNTGISRVEYTGSCHPTIEESKDPSASVLTQNTIPVQLQGHVLNIQSDSEHDMIVRDIRGNVLWSAKNSNQKKYNVKQLTSSEIKTGVVFVQVTMQGASKTIKVPLM